MSDYIRLKYNMPILPVLADRDGETVGNWTVAGNHSISASATDKHTGTKSLQIVAGGAGVFASDYVCIAEGAHSPALTVGKKYCINFWAKAGNANTTLKMEAGGVQSSAIALSTSWAEYSFVLTSVDATYWFAMALSQADTVYIDDIAFYEYEDYGIVIDKGLRRPEKFSFVPPIVNIYSDFSSDTQFKACIRKINLQTVALSDAQLKAHLRWGLDNDRLVDYSIQSVAEFDLVFIVQPDQEVQWYGDFTLTPYLQVNFEEGIARTDWPT